MRSGFFGVWVGGHVARERQRVPVKMTPGKEVNVQDFLELQQEQSKESTVLKTFCTPPCDTSAETRGGGRGT